MFRKRAVALVIGLALSSLGLGVVGSASAALLGQPANSPFIAIYGSPGTNAATIPVGGGLGRNFGFGENMLFEASTEGKVGKNIEIIVLEKKSISEDGYIGGTLQSNKTGENNPLGFVIQFADLQNGTVGGAATPHYADTSDRPWITTICAPGAKECRVDPLFMVGGGPDVKIEDVSLDLGGLVLQGTIWGSWINGKSKVPPCIKLENKPIAAGANQTLSVTQGGTIGTAITSISGEFCLVSANNDWYRFGSAANEPAITIENR